MTVEEIKKYCRNKHKVTEEFPFGDVPICYKLNGKIFAQLYPYEYDYKITLKCTADAGQFYRMIYPGKVVRGYHCPPVQQPYWNTVYLNDFPDDELLNMIDMAYDTVFSKFSKKEQKRIVEERNNMKLLYGTTNKAKITVMENAVKNLGIELISLNDLDSELPIINENGKTPLENAEIKAKAYYEAFHIPVFSCDSGLYFDELEEEEQPGLYIRRVNGKELTDEEMTEYYASLAAKHGGELMGRYRNAIYLIMDENTTYSSMDMSIATEPFILTSIPHSKRVEGFPLDSLSKDIKTGEYYYDLEEREVSSNVEDGLRDFFLTILQELNGKGK